MDREDRILTYVGLIIAIILGFLGVIFTINPSFLEPYAQTVVWILFISMFGTIVGIVVLFIKTREKPNVENSALRNVSIYYTSDNFHDGKYYLYNPKYIANTRTKQIYLMSNDFIERHVQTQQITSWKAYSSEKKLKAELLSQDFNFNPTEATYRDLGIYCCPSGALLIVENVINSSTLAKLKVAKENRKLEDYELIFLFPWRQFSKKSELKNFPPSKRLLLNHDTGIARPPPEGDLWLYNDHIFKFNVHSKHFPLEKLSWWCFFHGFPFKRRYYNDKPYEISELL